MSQALPSSAGRPAGASLAPPPCVNLGSAPQPRGRSPRSRRPPTPCSPRRPWARRSHRPTGARPAPRRWSGCRCSAWPQVRGGGRPSALATAAPVTKREVQSREPPPAPPRGESGCARGAPRASLAESFGWSAPKLIFCVTRPQKHSRSFSISRLFIYFAVLSASLALTGRAGCFLLSGGILVAHQGFLLHGWYHRQPDS